MEPRTVAGALGRVELFSRLDHGALQELAERIHGGDQRVPRGKQIFVQGELGDRMFLLVEGAVRLLVRSWDGSVVELVRHLPPSVFGEIAVLDGGERTATAEAVTDSTVIPVPRAELLRLLQSSSEVMDGLLRSLGTIVRRTTRQLTDLVFLDLDGRVARQLLLLAGRDADGVLRTAPLTQSELADRVGGARQTVNQALRRFEERGFIRRGAERVVEILDPQALQRRTRP
jgi:CRP/FNR family transcriptional regulator, cyclic AMP receptor protein